MARKIPIAKMSQIPMMGPKFLMNSSSTRFLSWCPLQDNAARAASHNQGSGDFVDGWAV